MDKLVAEQADFLRRWFELGAAMKPAELRARVEEEEARALDGAQHRGLVLYLPDGHAEGGQNHGTAGRVGASRP